MAADPFLPPSTPLLVLSIYYERKKVLAWKNPFSFQDSREKKWKEKRSHRKLNITFFLSRYPFFWFCGHIQSESLVAVFFCEWTQWLVIPSSLFMHAYPSPSPSLAFMLGDIFTSIW